MDIIAELNRNKGRLLNLLDPYYGDGISGTKSFFIPCAQVAQTAVAITANETRVMEFILPTRAIFGRATINCAANGAAGRTAGIGIYYLDGTLAFSTTFDLTTAGVKTNTFTPVSLAAGEYYYAWTCNNVTPTFTTWTTDATVYNTVLNTTTKHAGTATASSAGAVPSPLGTITAASVSPILCILEGI